MKRNRLQTSLAATAVAALLLTGCAGGGVSDSDRSSAEEAALGAVGGAGVVTDVGSGDGDDLYAYDVDVDLENGEDVEVELDDDFSVLNQPQIDSELNASASPASPAPSEPSASATDDALTTESPAPSSSSQAGVPADVDDDTRLTGRIREQAITAAQAEVGQGRIQEATYADRDEQHVYEVEVEIRPGADDDDVTVELDADFAVVRVDN